MPKTDRHKPRLQQTRKLLRPPDQSTPQVQGEGDYEGARRYRDDVEKFVATADIEKAARRAAPRDQREAAELNAAEETGRRRVKRGRADKT